LPFVLLFAAFSTQAQIISQFNWNSNPVTTALIGPNATSAGASAVSSSGGVGGTNGLNPGAPTANDINLVVPNTGSIFDIPNIDISVDYRRNETTAQIVKRSTFTFNTGGTVATFRVTYRVNNGATITTVVSAAIAIPQDAVFRTYRFTYDNCSGIGTMYVNAATVWTSSPTTPGQNLYWVGDGNLVIGQDMDGANNNIPNVDNFILQPFTCITPLPIELLQFNGYSEKNSNVFYWSTATEKNNDFFTLERSTDGLNWQTVQKVYGAGTSSSQRDYTCADLNPEKRMNYYRLVQTDDSGEFKIFNSIAINNESNEAVSVIKTLDLYGRSVPSDYEGPKIVFLSDGRVLKRLQQ
jgi:hypothetical protein